MKFSMIFEGQMTDIRRETEQQVLRDCVEQAVLADEMGFDRIWSVEHHALKYYASLSSSEIFLSYVAALTKNIRIGHGVICLPFPFNHPVRVAERTAMLDVLSGGRLDVGAGRGATPQEMALYGVDPDKTYDQMEESMRIVSRIWTAEEDTFEWRAGVDGATIDIIPPEGGAFTVVPRPQQAPHPPLFMACTHKDTLKLAAEWGVGALVLGFGGAEEMKELNDFYRQYVSERTGDKFVSPVTHNDWFGALCPTMTLSDRAEAIRIGVRGQRFFAEAIAHWYGGGPIPTDVNKFGDELGADEEIDLLKKSEEQFFAYLHEAKIPIDPGPASGYNPNQAYGDPDDAIRYVQSLKDVGVDEVMCLIQCGTVPQEACLETIRHWGETVIPHFRNA